MFLQMITAVPFSSRTFSFRQRAPMHPLEGCQGLCESHNFLGLGHDILSCIRLGVRLHIRLYLALCSSDADCDAAVRCSIPRYQVVYLCGFAVLWRLPDCQLCSRHLDRYAAAPSSNKFPHRKQVLQPHRMLRTGSLPHRVLPQMSLLIPCYASVFRIA